jgi:hypothetical protein
MHYMEKAKKKKKKKNLFGKWISKEVLSYVISSLKRHIG